MVNETSLSENGGFGLKDRFMDANGGWSTSADGEEDLKKDSSKPFLHTVIALDLLRIQPIAGVQTLQVSFLDAIAEDILAGIIERDAESSGDKEARTTPPSVDLVLSDMAPNISGNRIHDVEASMELCEKAFGFACRYLRRNDQRRGHGQKLGGNLV